MGFALLMFSACQEDTLVDRAAPDVNSAVDIREATDFTITAELDLMQSETSSFTRYRLEAAEEGSGEYVISGSGEAFSEEFGEARVRTYLRYDAAVELLQGRVDYYFSSGTISMVVKGEGIEQDEATGVFVINLETDVLSVSGDLGRIKMEARAQLTGAENLGDPKVNAFDARLLTAGVYRSEN